MAEKVGGRLGLSLVPSKGNWSWVCVCVEGGAFLGPFWLLLGLCSLGRRGVT